MGNDAPLSPALQGVCQHEYLASGSAAPTSRHPSAVVAVAPARKRPPASRTQPPTPRGGCRPQGRNCQGLRRTHPSTATPACPGARHQRSIQHVQGRTDRRLAQPLIAPGAGRGGWPRATSEFTCGARQLSDDTAWRATHRLPEPPVRRPQLAMTAIPSRPSGQVTWRVPTERVTSGSAIFT